MDVFMVLQVVSLPSQTCPYKARISENSFVVKADVVKLRGKISPCTLYKKKTQENCVTRSPRAMSFEQCCNECSKQKIKKPKHYSAIMRSMLHQCSKECF